MLRVITCISDPQLFLLLQHVLVQEGFCASLLEHQQDQQLAETPSLILSEFPDRTGTLNPLLERDETRALPLILLMRQRCGHTHLPAATLLLQTPFRPDDLIDALRKIRANASRRGEARDTTSRTAGKRILSYADIEVDLASHQTRRGGRLITLTGLQLRLLSHLITRAGSVCGRDELIEACWPAGVFVEPRTVDIHIGEIRRRLRTDGPDPIRTVRGAGYGLIDC